METTRPRPRPQVVQLSPRALSNRGSALSYGTSDFPPSKLQEIVDLLKAGMTYRKIADITGISTPTVCRINSGASPWDKRVADLETTVEGK